MITISGSVCVCDEDIVFDFDILDMGAYPHGPFDEYLENIQPIIRKPLRSYVQGGRASESRHQRRADSTQLPDDETTTP